jgi:hypothetical protein
VALDLINQSGEVMPQPWVPSQQKQQYFFSGKSKNLLSIYRNILTLNDYVIAWGVCKFVHSAAISIVMAIFSLDDLSVVGGIQKDFSLCSSRNSCKFGCLSEIEFVLVRESGNFLG